MSKLKPWISAMRLRTLPLSVSGVVIGTCMAYYNGAFNWGVFILALMVTTALQILSNLANDYGDGVKGTDNNERLGPKRAIQSGAISPQDMLEAIKMNILIIIFLVLALLFFAFGFTNFFYVLLFVALGGFSVYAAITYTMGDSPYGYKALGDVFVFIFFGLLSVLGTYFLNVKQLDHVVLLPAISLGMLSMAVLNLNNMRDIDSDEKSGKITVAVKLGLKKAKQYHYILVFGAMLLTALFFVLYYVSSYNALVFISYIPLLIHLRIISKTDNPEAFDKQLKVLALSTFLFSLLLGVGYILF
ncbi:1,4-dihydroxy-2-naphthoate octaprenyltransferase [Winogradskyella aurantiaca]|uniref:1,4-dihydroxy-2-naphthoate octaprenyltransferase n=1 Tax=Winogradskyella aurantiaca TaxID=2219558 RepID=UPI000E1C6947|nr:1,4-dihydroxy-2-naphthoate octaprenyltransferase [Winogradskyella aurantiaca]